MIRADYCYLSVRACAHDGAAGSFIQAAKLFPAITADAVHRAPFHPIHFDVVYAPESPSVVDPALRGIVCLECVIVNREPSQSFF